jgi:polyhydroxybutyrate depolymerase
MALSKRVRPDLVFGRRRSLVPLVGLVLVLGALAGCNPAWTSSTKLTVSNVTATSLDVSWPVPILDGDTTVTEYAVLIDGVTRTVLPGSTRSVHLGDLAPSTAYSVEVRATDGKNQVSIPGLKGAATTSANSAVITERRTITVGTLTRSYRLDIPAGYKGSVGARLVLGIHGGGGSPDNFATTTGLPAAAAASGWVVAYPEGTKGSAGFTAWNAGGCCGGASGNKVDDVGFIDALIRQLQGRFAATKTVLIGHSNGAMLSYRMACERAGLIDGFASVAGDLFFSPCTPARPVPLLEIHGLADTNVPFNGGPGSTATYPPVMDGINLFRTNNGCGATPATSTSNGVVTATYSCTTARGLRLITIDDAQHAWPGGLNTGVGGTPSTKLDATATVRAWADSL